MSFLRGPSLSLKSNSLFSYPGMLAHLAAMAQQQAYAIMPHAISSYLDILKFYNFTNERPERHTDQHDGPKGRLITFTSKTDVQNFINYLFNHHDIKNVTSNNRELPLTIHAEGNEFYAYLTPDQWAKLLVNIERILIPAQNPIARP